MSVFTSAFLTSHDTIGTSTLGTPAHLPSSPPQLTRTHQASLSDKEQTSSNNPSRDVDGENTHKKASDVAQVASLDSQQNELDRRLAQYSIDWNKLPGGSTGKVPHHADEHEDDDADSEIGGPEDFTMNLDKYFLGEQEPRDQRKDDHVKERGQTRFETRSPPTRRDQEAPEYSEFGPPVDMSTPSHLLWRKNIGTGKEGTQLYDIEESFANTPPDQPGTPLKRAEEDHPEDDTYATVLREIEHLQEELRDRDEKLRENHQRALKASSSTQEIRHLRAELHKKSTLLSEANAKLGNEELLREQIKILQKQNDENKTLLLQEANERSSSVEVLQQQVADLKAELRKRDEIAVDNEDNSKALESLRQQLSETKGQLEKRDQALEDSASKLREMTSSTNLQLRQKNSIIEDLKAQLDDRELEIDKMEEELAEANREYAALEERIGSLESRNRPLEEKNIVLEHEANQAKNEIIVQQKAITILAANALVNTDNKTFNEIIDALESWCQSKQVSDAASQKESKTDELQMQIAQLQVESKEAASAKEVAESELKRSQDFVAESRALITTVESENARLTSRLHELNKNLTEVREELRRVKKQHAISPLGNIELSSGESAAESRLTTRKPEQNDQEYRSIQDAHRNEIKGLQDVHTSAITTLRNSYTETIDNLRHQLTESEKREADLRSDLRVLRNSTSSQKHEVSGLRAEVHRLESVLAIKEETSVDVDGRIARSVEKREREWERRIDLLLKERDQMSKTLMWEWGKKEVGGRRKDPNAGPGGEENSKPKQGYRYKYVVRS